jgi:hypothetical protein
MPVVVVSMSLVLTSGFKNIKINTLLSQILTTYLIVRVFMYLERGCLGFVLCRRSGVHTSIYRHFFVDRSRDRREFGVGNLETRVQTS